MTNDKLTLFTEELDALMKKYKAQRMSYNEAYDNIFGLTHFTDKFVIPEIEFKIEISGLRYAKR